MGTFGILLYKMLLICSDDDDEEVEEDEEEPSMHMCGRCKITFTDLATFIQHRAKKTCKKVARTPSPKVKHVIFIPAVV